MLERVGGRKYRLVVEGELSEAIGFEGMTLTHRRGNTVLTGPVRDQAEFQALLLRLSDLGLTLIEAKVIGERGKRSRSPQSEMRR
jgi:hypothetical protein